MKCILFRCPREAVAAPAATKKLIRPPLMDLCAEHQRRYQRDYTKHFKPLVMKLAKRWLTGNGVAQSRAEAVVEELQDEGHLKSWQAHWMQMIDLELLNAGHGAGGVKGEMKVVDGQEVWVPQAEIQPRPSAPTHPSAVAEYARKTTLPEHATQKGQSAIARRLAEEMLLERRLQAETAEFQRGQRAVLTQELKTKRETELLAAAKKAKGS